MNLNVTKKMARPACWSADRRNNAVRTRAFSLVEILVVVALLSLIVLALMAVFSSTQNAFRASVTQTDVLEGGRNTADMIATDLKEMYRSGSANAVNFYVNTNFNFIASFGQPLIQLLPAGAPPMRRTNVLEDVFILTRENQTWTGIGYKVDFTNGNSINALYRFSWSTNIHADPATIYTNFLNASFSQMSHVLDGVVDLRVRAYDTNGFQMTRASAGVAFTNNTYFPPMVAVADGEGGIVMFSNTLPASVEFQLGVLEDRALQRAESLPNNLPASPPGDRRTLYLQNHAGQVHIFRQRVTIPNVDLSAYK